MKNSKFVPSKVEGLQSKIQNCSEKLIPLLIGLLTGSVIFLIATNSVSNLKRKSGLKQELIYWKDVAVKHPEYPDIWAKLASCWYNLDNQELARLAIEKARKLDPTREEIKTLEMRISR